MLSNNSGYHFNNPGYLSNNSPEGVGTPMRVMRGPVLDGPLCLILYGFAGLSR